MSVETEATRLLFVLQSNTVWSAILFAFVLPLTMLLRRAAPQARHALWLIVLVRLVLPPGFALPISAGALVLHAPPVASGDLALREALEMVVPSRSETAPAHAGLLASLWLVGFAIAAGALLRRRFSLTRVAKRGTPVENPEITTLVESWREAHSIRRTIRVVRSDSGEGPFTIGTLRPVIVLPDRLLERLEPAAVECVVAHELAHVQRFDDLALAIQAVIQSAYFFHPVAWIAAAFRTEEAELACDRLAIRETRATPSDYGRSLLDVLRLELAPIPWPSAFIGRKRRIRMRIESLVTARSSNRLLTGAAVLVGALALPIVELPAVANPTVPPATPVASEQGKPVHVEGDIVPPQPIHKVSPVYPEDARKDKAEGTVILEAVIDTTGAVKNVKILQTPRDDFGKAAADAVRQWVFEPATLEGKPVEVIFTMTIRFALDHHEK